MRFNCTFGPSLWLLILVAYAVGGLGFLDTVACGQELRKAIRDYRDDRVFNYQPSDPQYRGKLFNAHTGHYGKFYNCDFQENKRSSPYIHWKPHCENDFPTRLGFCENLRRDITEIKQRISDGAGSCGTSCRCQQCQPRNHWQPTSPPQRPVFHSDCPCAQCAISRSQPNSSTEISNVASTASQQTKSSCNCASCRLSSSSNSIGDTNRNPTLAQNYSNKSYGLVSGKIFQPTLVAQRDAPQQMLEQVEVSPLPFEKVSKPKPAHSPKATVARLETPTIKPTKHPTTAANTSSRVQR